MPELTAEQLHQIVDAVWKLHPETRPTQLEYTPVVWSLEGCDCIDMEAATQLCEAGMVRWLARQHDDGVAVFVNLDGWNVADGKRAFQDHPTLVEALAAACLAVPEKKT